MKFQEKKSYMEFKTLLKKSKTTEFEHITKFNINFTKMQTIQQNG